MWVIPQKSLILFKYINIWNYKILSTSFLNNLTISVFKPDTHFKELEDWSSLVALSVIAMIDEEYDVSLKGDDLLKSDTIQELFERIKK